MPDTAGKENPQQVVLFIDTNILLHFKPLKEIDWLEVTGAKAVRLVICLEVIKELDKHKRNTRLQKRAERAIRESRNTRIMASLSAMEST